MSTLPALEHDVVSHDRWMQVHREFLAKEKELTKLSDQVAKQRLQLPWMKIDKEYLFNGPKGRATLPELFAGRSQLATYHFMFGPDWNEGCPNCSFVTDHLNGMVEHLAARDITLVLVSRAPQERLAAFERRLGWHLPWYSSGTYSSGESDFNHDFRVSFSQADVDAKVQEYNLGSMPPYQDENPGLTFFYKDPSGAVFRTYSLYARGVEALLGTYQLLDRSPRGRDEEQFSWPMEWVKYHDKYEPTVHGIALGGHDTP